MSTLSSSPTSPPSIRQIPNLPGEPLTKSYPGRRGAPIIDRVDDSIFTRRYFMRCMECTFCHDSCCQYGADIDLPNMERLLQHKDALEARIGIPASEWFNPELIEDPDFPGRLIHRTRRVNSACVFLNRQGRGCHIHSYAMSQGLDYHEIKPTICWLFPLTVDRGLLHPNEELRDGDLVCLGPGPTLYESQRDELRYHFGDELVDELDERERRTKK